MCKPGHVSKPGFETSTRFRGIDSFCSNGSESTRHHTLLASSYLTDLNITLTTKQTNTLQKHEQGSYCRWPLAFSLGREKNVSAIIASPTNSARFFSDSLVNSQWTFHTFMLNAVRLYRFSDVCSWLSIT